MAWMTLRRGRDHVRVVAGCERESHGHVECDDAAQEHAAHDHLMKRRHRHLRDNAGEGVDIRSRIGIGSRTRFGIGARVGARIGVGVSIGLAIALVDPAPQERGTDVRSAPRSARAQGASMRVDEHKNWATHNLRALGQFGGPISGLAVEEGGRTGWATIGHRLVALDLTQDPPRIVARSQALPARAQRVTVADGLAIVEGVEGNGLRGNELWVLDVHDRSWPRWVSTISVPNLEGGAALRDGVLAVGASGRIQMVDLRDPRRPVKTHLVGHPGSVNALSFGRTGLNAYWGTDLVTLAVTPDAEADVTRIWPLPGLEGLSTWVSGDLRGDSFGMFKARSGRDGGTPVVLAIDLEGEGEPTILGTWDVDPGPKRPHQQRLVMGDGRMFVLQGIEDEYSVLHAFDLRNSDTPQVLPALPTLHIGANQWSATADADGDVLLAVGFWGRIHAWRAGERGLAEAGVLDVGYASASKIVGDGDRLVAIDQEGGVYRFALDSTNGPQLEARSRVDWVHMTSYQSPRYMEDVAPGPDRTWLITGDGYLVGLPPEHEGTYWHGTIGLKLDLQRPFHLAAEGAYALVAATDRLAVYGWGPEERPLAIGEIEWPDGPWAVTDIVVVNGYAWLASSSGTPGLRVVDVRDPSNMRIVRDVRGSRVEALTTSDNYVYVLSTSSVELRLSVLDARDPTAPKTLGEIDVPHLRTGPLVVKDGHAYVAAQDSVRVIDLSIPARPEEVAWLRYSGTPIGMAVVDDVIWLADETRGLVSLALGRVRAERLALPWLSGTGGLR